MNIVYLTTEAVPFAKTGGLADVCGTLPTEISQLGHRCGLIMPAFSSIRSAGLTLETTDISFAIPMAKGKLVGCRVLKSHLPSHGSGAAEPIPVWFIDQPQYFDRPSLYGDSHGDYGDNAERFTFFCRAAIATMARLEFPVDLVHCNDWQTSLVPALLRHHPETDEALREVPTVLTIHNLAYQGNFPAEEFLWTGLGWDSFLPESFEYYGHFNFLKTGILTADRVTTVSPTYAQEIKTPLHGCGLDPILQGIGDRVSGIINGIDVTAWNPEIDPKIVRNFNAEDWLGGKRANKLALQAEVGLPPDKDVPLIGLVGRLADQKGWDLILPVIERHVWERRPTQWVVLGSGERGIEDRLRMIAGNHRDQVAVHVGFSDKLAHRIEAAADLFVMPSRYEPCGLNQLYSLRYGTVCVVMPTGGLADTIVNTTPVSIAAGTATGFHMSNYSIDGLDAAMGRALRIRYHEPEIWEKIVRRGMSLDFSWRKSANQYVSLYDDTVSLNRASRIA